MERPMPPEFTRTRRRLALRMSRMNRSLRAMATSGRVRAGIIAAEVDVKWRGLIARIGRSVNAPQIPALVRARIDQAVAVARGRDWSWPRQSIRTAMRRLHAAAVRHGVDWKDRPRGGLEQISERLNFGFSRKLPVLRQTEAAEC